MELLLLYLLGDFRSRWYFLVMLLSMRRVTYSEQRRIKLYIPTPLDGIHLRQQSS